MTLSSQLLLICRDTARPPGYGVALRQEVVVLPVVLNHWSRLRSCVVSAVIWSAMKWWWPNMYCVITLGLHMMTSSKGNSFRVTGPLCPEFTGHRWIPRTKASDAELWCFLWCAHWINGWANNHEAGDLGRYRARYDVFLMIRHCRNIETSWYWNDLLLALCATNSPLTGGFSPQRDYRNISSMRDITILSSTKFIFEWITSIFE